MASARSCVLVAALVLACGMALFSERSAFPFYYHPDEPGKALQLVHRSKNLHHPLLLLTTADLARRVFLQGDAEKDPQAVIELARRVVAAFAAASAALLALLATRLLGVPAGLCAGLLLVSHPLLYELAHYVKEDPPFLFGVVACALAAQHASTRRDARSLRLLGAAAGVAAAGKYVGVALVPVAAALGAGTGGGSARERWRRAGRVAGSALLTWLVLDWWIVRSPERLPQSLARETAKALLGEHGLVKEVPHAYYVGVQAAYGGAFVPALAALWLAAALWRPRKVPVPEWLLAGTALGLAAALSCTPKTSPRYYLPVAAALGYLAVAGAFRCAALAGARWPRARALATGVAVALCASAAWQQGRDTQEVRRGFRHDDRAELLAAVAALPPSAVVAQDEAAELPEPARRWQHRGREPLRQTVLGARHAPDLGSLPELRARGVTHLALCERTYGRFFAADRVVTDEASVAARRAFYRTALERGRVVRRWEQGRVTHLQPGLVLLDVSALE
jgi:hypothetical protein